MGNARHSGGSGCAGVWLGAWKYNDFTEENRLNGSSVDASNVPDVVSSQPSCDQVYALRVFYSPPPSQRPKQFK